MEQTRISVVKTYRYRGDDFPRLNGHEFTVPAFAAAAGISEKEALYRLSMGGGEWIADTRPKLYGCVSCRGDFPQVSRHGLCRRCEIRAVESDYSWQKDAGYCGPHAHK